MVSTSSALLDISPYSPLIRVQKFWCPTQIESYLKSQGKLKYSTFFGEMSESTTISRSSHEHKLTSKVTSPLLHRVLTWPQVGRLDFWWSDQYLLLPFNWVVSTFYLLSLSPSPSSPLFVVVLGIDPRAPLILRRCSTTELKAHLCFVIYILTTVQ